MIYFDSVKCIRCGAFNYTLNIHCRICGKSLDEDIERTRIKLERKKEYYEDLKNINKNLRLLDEDVKRTRNIFKNILKCFTYIKKVFIFKSNDNSRIITNKSFKIGRTLIIEEKGEVNQEKNISLVDSKQSENVNSLLTNR